MSLPSEIGVDIAFTTNATSTNPAWESVVDPMLEFNTFRGRRGDSDSSTPGTATTVLDDPDGIFDADNTTGPHTGFIRPNRRIRIWCRETPASPITYLHHGYVTSWRRTSPGGGTSSRVEINSTDRFLLLNRRTNSGNTVAEMTDDRIVAILAGIGLTPAEYSVNPDNYVTRNIVAKTYTEENTLSALEEVTLSEGGLLYVNGAGVVVWQGSRFRLDNPRANTSQAVWGNGPSATVPVEADIDPTVDVEMMANRILLRDGAGVLRIANDPALGLEDGVLVFDLGSTLLRQGGGFTDAQDRAEDLLLLRKYPRPRYGTVTLDARTSDDALHQALTRELSDRITLAIGSSTRDQHIESIAHDVKPYGPDARWRTTVTVSAA